jgi:hypothetical protein
MDKYETTKMPIGLQMAFSTNVSSFKTFLSLDDKSQDEIIEKSKGIKTKRELQALVNSISLK